MPKGKSTTPTTRRVKAVQVPGETQPAATPETPPDQPAKETAESKTKASVDRPNRRHYSEMSADEIDASKLTKAVLSKDGWVVPKSAEKKV